MTARVASGAVASILCRQRARLRQQPLALDDAIDDAPSRGLGPRRSASPVSSISRATASGHRSGRGGRSRPSRGPGPASPPAARSGPRESRRSRSQESASSKPPPAGVAVHRRDDGLVEVEELGQPRQTLRRPKASGSPGSPAAWAFRSHAGGEEAIARAGDDRDPQLRIVAKGNEGLAHRPARRRVDRVRLRAVDRQFERRSAPLDPHALHPADPTARGRRAKARPRGGRMGSRASLPSWSAPGSSRGRPASPTCTTGSSAEVMRKPRVGGAFPE